MSKINGSWIVTGSIATIAVVGGATLAAADTQQEAVQSFTSTTSSTAVAPEAATATPVRASNEILRVTTSAYTPADVVSAVSAQTAPDAISAPSAVSAQSPATVASPVSAQTPQSPATAPSPVSAQTPQSPASAPSAPSADA